MCDSEELEIRSLDTGNEVLNIAVNLQHCAVLNCEHECDYLYGSVVNHSVSIFVIE